MSSLDELPEFSQRVLEALRQPLEDARVVVSRSAGTASFPARFQLVAAANPCRRGCASIPTCACSPAERARYLARLSRPLLDRIDLHLEIPALAYAQLTDAAAGEPSAVIRARVLAARARQATRFTGTATHVNARMSGRQTRRHCPLPADATRLLGLAVTRLGLSARAHDRLLRVARTIADPGERRRHHRRARLRGHPVPRARPRAVTDGLLVSLSPGRSARSSRGRRLDGAPRVDMARRWS